MPFPLMESSMIVVQSSLVSLLPYSFERLSCVVYASDTAAARTLRDSTMNDGDDIHINEDGNFTRGLLFVINFFLVQHIS